jgi:hypothetical protein
MAMKYLFALSMAFLILSAGALAGDVIVQDQTTTVADTANVVANYVNEYTVNDGEDAVIIQNIDVLGLSTQGSVTQDAINIVDLTNVVSTDNILIDQNIVETAWAQDQVTQTAENLIYDSEYDNNVVLGESATVTQNIEQIAYSDTSLMIPN